MIIRVVKMTFRIEEIENFKTVFKNSKEKIRGFPGVQHLELLQANDTPNIFFTYSYWKTAEDLEKYRHSALFKTVWSKTKPLFKEKAEAWSTNRLHNLE